MLSHFIFNSSIPYPYNWGYMSYISCCDRYQYFKVGNIAPAGKFQSLEVPHISWVDVTANFITDLLLSNNFDSILVIID